MKQNFFYKRAFFLLFLTVIFEGIFVILLQETSFAINNSEIYGKTNVDNNGSVGKMDYQGYTYNVVKIGTQWWMAENLRSTMYNDGTLIQPSNTHKVVLLEDKIPAILFESKVGRLYGYKKKGLSNAYGNLYNWYAVETGKLAPLGWHVPSKSEWRILIKYLGGKSKAGGKMKSVDFDLWAKPNKAATNESGFSGLPGGGINNLNPDKIYGLGVSAMFWTSSKSTFYGVATILRNDEKNAKYIYRPHDFGYSVRCILD